MPYHDHVREHARVPAIAIREGMNRNDSIVKPDRDLVGRVNAKFQPAAYFLVEAPKMGPSGVGRDADVCLTLANFPSPFPDVAEHLFVKVK
jgi:hypothetical protein